MGKKNRNRKGGLPPKPSSTSAGNKGPAYKADQLLDRVDEYMEALEFDLAFKFADRALKTEPNNTRALETMASLLLDQGEPESAYQCLQRAIELSPDVGHTKYMYMGQLHGGHEAIQYFEKGIAILQASPAEGNEGLALNSQIASALCSIAELYMTDLCDEPDAESRCRNYLERAVESDPNSWEAWQTMASYCISAQRPEDAKSALERSMSQWLIESDEDALASTAPLPPYEFRINTVRLLAELGVYAPALKILERLRKEDDEVVDTWYLGGWLAHLTEDVDMAMECLDAARQLFHKVGCDDTQMLEHIEELLNEYSAKGLYNPNETVTEDPEADWVDEEDMDMDE